RGGRASASRRLELRAVAARHPADAVGARVVADDGLVPARRRVPAVAAGPAGRRRPGGRMSVAAPAAAGPRRRRLATALSRVSLFDGAIIGAAAVCWIGAIAGTHLSK